jgi:hypothetical protein
MITMPTMKAKELRGMVSNMRYKDIENSMTAHYELVGDELLDLGKHNQAEKAYSESIIYLRREGFDTKTYKRLVTKLNNSLYERSFEK